MPRGRAASPVRPGYVIKAVLTGKQPLINPSGGQTGELIEEACPTDIHLTYQALIHEENQLRPRSEHLHGMTTDSFCKLMRFARLMGLIEFIRNEPAIFPPVGGNFYRVEMYDTKAGVRKPKAVISDRKIHRITEKGKIEEKAWGDLRRAWQEHWEVGIHHEPETPPVETTPITIPTPERRGRGRPRKTPVVAIPETPVAGTTAAPEVQKAVEWKPIKLSETPSMKQFKKLHAHLVKLSKIGFRDKAVYDEVMNNIDMTVGDWIADLDDPIRKHNLASEPDKLKELNSWIDALNKVTESFHADPDNPKFQPAIIALAGLI